jgi:hypothetical protein
VAERRVPVEVELHEVLERAHFYVQVAALDLEQALEDDLLALVQRLVVVVSPARPLPRLLHLSFPVLQ